MALMRVDDLDGSPDDVRTVVLGYGGKAFVLDLGSKNRGILMDVLQPILEKAFEYGEMPEAPEPPSSPVPKVAEQPKLAVAARRRRRRVAVSAPSAAKSAASARQDVRTWARENGHAVSDTGRISAHVQQAYDDAHA